MARKEDGGCAQGPVRENAFLKGGHRQENKRTRSTRAPGAEVDKVVFHELDVRDNRYAIQVHSDLVNGLLGAIGLNSDDAHLLPGTDPRNSKLFFTEVTEGDSPKQWSESGHAKPGTSANITRSRGNKH